MYTRNRRLQETGVAPRTVPASQLDAEAAWAAVSTRDSQWDGRIFYAVQSTGIYCRPSCPSRKPYRDQVRFFLTPDEAEQAGFRACRRCRPNTSGLTSAEHAVQRALHYLAEHPDTRVTLDVLAHKAGMTLSHFQRTFTRIVGMSPKKYGDALRMGLLKTELRRGGTVSTATYAAGFGSSSSVYHHATQQLGMTPGTYKRRGRDTTIDYVIVETSLGRLLVATTDRGICAVVLGDNDAIVESELEHEYPNATLHRIDDLASSTAENHQGFHAQVQAIVAYIEGRQQHIVVPIDVTATPFEQRVWDALREIPYGETRTYTDLATTLGKPEAVRAVAQACAKNPVAVVVPCHRVLRKDGSMGGYRWGIPRKVELLEREKRG